MLIELNEIEARILGSLVEKSLTTPEQYPLSFNALVNACNQKSSRDPVMSLDSNAVGSGVNMLVEQGFAERHERGRVPKILHHIDKLMDDATPQAVAAICVLLLRGPQTPGEIKTRSERLHKFTSPAEVEILLRDMASRADGPWVARLPRQPGRKEARYQHLFCGAPADAAPEPAAERPAAKPDLLARLEKRVEALEAFRKTLEGRIDKLP
ncbi:MAG: YceH family protein [Elusimicrobiota bacterium]